MDKSRIRETVFAELIRLETQKVIERLDRSYTDGGIKAGERHKALAEMAVQAYQDARYCAEQVWVWSQNNE